MGAGKYDGSTMIILRSSGRNESQSCSRVLKSWAHVEHPYARRDEYFDIYLCRGLKAACGMFGRAEGFDERGQ